MDRRRFIRGAGIAVAGVAGLIGAKASGGLPEAGARGESRELEVRVEAVDRLSWQVRITQELINDGRMPVTTARVLSAGPPQVYSAATWGMSDIHSTGTPAGWHDSADCEPGCPFYEAGL